MVDYTNFGQGLQSSLASNALFWIITLALVFFIIAVMVTGFKKIANPRGLKWLLLHSLSIFLIGYFLKDFTLNKYLVVFIFAFFVTFLSTIYRYFMFKVNDKMKNRGVWFVINLLTLLVVQILFDVINVTNSTLKIFFAGFCLTLVGALIHRDFKHIGSKNHRGRHRFRHH
jgi:hypothetical protein